MKQLKTTPVLFTACDYTLQSSLVLTKSSVCVCVCVCVCARVRTRVRVCVMGLGGAASQWRAQQSWSCLDKCKMEMFDKK